MNIINGKKIRGEVIDWYHLNLFCVCRDCKKREGHTYSCEAHPNINGIPRKIWNTPHAECPDFEAKDVKDDDI